MFYCMLHTEGYETLSIVLTENIFASYIIPTLPDREHGVDSQIKGGFCKKLAKFESP